MKGVRRWVWKREKAVGDAERDMVVVRKGIRQLEVQI